jgi:membrane dipeptidase
MNETGMVVCGSHCGYRTARELIDFSETPVIFSHSNPRAVWDHPRNIPDEIMLACARRGGVIGINGFGPFLGNNDASTSAYVKHVEYALSVVGEDHVGVGLDFVYDVDEMNALFKQDPASFPPALYEQGPRMVEPWKLPEIAKTLSDRGHRLSTLQKIFGGNFLRIAREVWR